MKKIQTGTLTELLKGHEKVYVYCSTGAVCKRLFRDAEDEGFSFGKGRPTAAHTSDIIALNRDFTMNYVTCIGRMAFAACPQITDKRAGAVKLDYAKYLIDGSF